MTIHSEMTFRTNIGCYVNKSIIANLLHFTTEFSTVLKMFLEIISFEKPFASKENLHTQTHTHTHTHTHKYAHTNQTLFHHMLT